MAHASLPPCCALLLSACSMGPMVNDARIIMPDAMAGSSVVNVIDRVLMPPSMMSPSPSPSPSPESSPESSPVGSGTTIVTVATIVPDLSTLLAAVSSCPSILNAALNASSTVTVFAPTNTVSPSVGVPVGVQRTSDVIKPLR